MPGGDPLRKCLLAGPAASVACAQCCYGEGPAGGWAEERRRLASGVVFATGLSKDGPVRRLVHNLLPPLGITPNPQAKTTKKIVLRMQCQECKQTCMKGLKVGAGDAAAGAGQC